MTSHLDACTPIASLSVLRAWTGTSHTVSDRRAWLPPEARSHTPDERTVRIRKHAADGTHKERVMAESQLNPIVQLRKNVRDAEKALHEAEVRESALAAALKTDPSDAARLAHRNALADLASAEEALANARAELDNFLEDQHEASADEPLPQTDYRLREIVAKLSHYRQRATYAAVGEFLNASAWMVRGWFKENEAFDNSFIVSADSGEPTNYPDLKVHQSLKTRPMILKTSDELLAWLQAHPLKLR
jgi:hypothetical protein